MISAKDANELATRVTYNTHNNDAKIIIQNIDGDIIQVSKKGGTVCYWNLGSLRHPVVLELVEKELLANGYCLQKQNLTWTITWKNAKGK